MENNKELYLMMHEDFENLQKSTENSFDMINASIQKSNENLEVYLKEFVEKSDKISENFRQTGKERMNLTLAKMETALNGIAEQQKNCELILKSMLVLTAESKKMLSLIDGKKETAAGKNAESIESMLERFSNIQSVYQSIEEMLKEFEKK